jgi:hypothetical protein
MRKGKLLKQFWFSPSVIEALNFCRKERNFRSNREYIERLILEDQERIKRPPKDPVLEKIESLKEDVKRHIFLRVPAAYNLTSYWAR